MSKWDQMLDDYCQQKTNVQSGWETYPDNTGQTTQHVNTAVDKCGDIKENTTMTEITDDSAVERPTMPEITKSNVIENTVTAEIAKETETTVKTVKVKKVSTGKTGDTTEKDTKSSKSIKSGAAKKRSGRPTAKNKK